MMTGVISTMCTCEAEGKGNVQGQVREGGEVAPDVRRSVWREEADGEVGLMKRARGESERGGGTGVK